MVGAERGHQRADRLKPQSQKTKQTNHMDHSLVELNEIKPCCVWPPKMDVSWCRVLTKCGTLEKGMANHFSILALRTPWTVWRVRQPSSRKFCESLSRNTLFHLYFKGFLNIEYLVDIFSFSTLNMSRFTVSSVLIKKKSAITVLLVPYCNVSFFSSSFKILSFPLAFSSLTMMCLCVVFCFHTWGLLSFLNS